MGKDDLNVHVFQYKNWRSPKSDRCFFLWLWLSENLSKVTFLSEKKYGVAGLISEKSEFFYTELKGTLMQIWKSVDMFIFT